MVHPSVRKHGSKAAASRSHGASEEPLKLRSSTAVAVAEYDAPAVSVKPIVHFEVPDLPQPQGELFVECSVFLYSVLALFLQYLNLYKTYWWLPNSHVHHSMKFYLVDPFLLSVVGLILGRRVTFCFMRKVTLDIPGLNVPIYLRVIEWLVKFAMTCIVMTSFMFSMSRVLVVYSWTSVLFLFYPLVIFCLIFARKVTFTAVKESTPKNTLWRLVDIISCGEQSRSQLSLGQGHACSFSPYHIREEVEILYADFLSVFWQSMFSSLVAAYYAVFVPCCFTPGTLYIDWTWVCELSVLIFMTTWIVQLAYVLPLQYCDLLHRSALHLGAWRKIDGVRNNPQVALPNQATWTDNDLWTEGQYVKHGRNVYRSEGVSIAAEPGNVDHSRFYFLFKDPLRIINSLCAVDGYVIVVQFFLLVHSSDWQHIVTLVLCMFANYITMFKLFKDKIIMGRIYNPPTESQS